MRFIMRVTPLDLTGHNLSMDGVFDKNYTGYAGIGIYCCWYEKDGYLYVSLSSLH